MQTEAQEEQLLPATEEELETAYQAIRDPEGNVTLADLVNQLSRRGLRYRGVVVKVRPEAGEWARIPAGSYQVNSGVENRVVPVEQVDGEVVNMAEYPSVVLTVMDEERPTPFRVDARAAAFSL